ncbi:MAG: shikimate dehydrogenase [Alphaproteobacteria bacterium]
MKRACVIGWPVEHSRSPLIHEFWLRAYGIEGAYEKQGVPPEAAEDFIRNLASHGFVGGNVTVPHKEVAFRVAGRLDEVAQAVGAVNTLWIDSGELYATNTDVHGFIHNLDHQAPDWDKSGLPALVLGAGGAARSIVYGLISRGFPQIRIVNRTRERADKLAASFGGKVDVYNWDRLSEAASGCGVLVNTTTQGMKGSGAIEIDLSALASSAVVNDIVYVPLETELLQRARQAGLRVADGLGMLLHQAAPAFQKWFGVYPEVSPELRAHIVADLDKH